MGFHATADPILTFTGFEPVGFIVTASPLLIFFVVVGETGRCAADPGEEGGASVPQNSAY
jgi:hypothetical protein